MRGSVDLCLDSQRARELGLGFVVTLLPWRAFQKEWTSCGRRFGLSSPYQFSDDNQGLTRVTFGFRVLARLFFRFA